MTDVNSMLTELEIEIAEMKKNFMEKNRQICARIEKIAAGRSSGMETQSFKRIMDSNETPKMEKKKIKSIERMDRPVARSPAMYSVRDVDQRLGTFYGSNDLRDAIKDANSKMHATVAVLQKVRDHSHSAFVRMEIEHVFKNVTILTQIFNRMVDRMELPDYEKFIEDDKTEDSKE